MNSSPKKHGYLGEEVYGLCHSKKKKKSFRNSFVERLFFVVVVFSFAACCCGQPASRTSG